MCSKAVQIIPVGMGIVAVILAGVSTIHTALMYHRPPTNNSATRDRNATDSSLPAQHTDRDSLVGDLSEITDLLTQIRDQSIGGTREIKEAIQGLVDALAVQAPAQLSSENHAAVG